MLFHISFYNLFLFPLQNFYFLHLTIIVWGFAFFVFFRGKSCNKTAHSGSKWNENKVMGRNVNFVVLLLWPGGMMGVLFKVLRLINQINLVLCQVNGIIMVWFYYFGEKYIEVNPIKFLQNIYIYIPIKSTILNHPIYFGIIVIYYFVHFFKSTVQIKVIFLGC